jgi:hypothetical protein
MLNDQWFWVVPCEKCARPIPLYTAPDRDTPIPPDDEPFEATCLQLNCNHRGSYRRAQIERRLVRSGG